jgi:two-component system, chemotaxis family, sensor kinase Cph1
MNNQLRNDLLRRRAEERLTAKVGESAGIPPEEVQTIIHELHVHQAEMEIQNEDLRRTQRELQASRDRYNDLYDQAPVGYLTLNESGVVLEINLTGAALLGIDRAYFSVQRRFDKFVAFHSQDTYHLHVNQVFNSGVRQSCELEMVKRDGTPFYAQVSSLPDHGGGGSTGGIRMTLSDITALKQVQDALQKSKEELEIRVRERTADLEEYARQLESSNRQLEDFAYVASHDLQEPLRKIQSFAGLLETLDKNDQMYLEYFNRMQGAARRMQEMIQDLLEYSRVTTKARPFRPVSLQDAVNEAIRILEIRLINTGGHVEIEDDLPTIEAEPTQIVRLFQNLLSNSLIPPKRGGADCKDPCRTGRKFRDGRFRNLRRGLLPPVCGGQWDRI